GCSRCPPGAEPRGSVLISSSCSLSQSFVFPILCCPFPYPAARVLCAAPEQGLHLYAVFRMSSLYGETKQVLIV
ncbi:hypothetical protein VN97_g12947, partial [Penicillium thymicola]